MISMPRYDRIHFKTISFVHETSYRLFVNPYKLLNAAGLKPRLAVGSGEAYTFVKVKIITKF